MKWRWMALSSIGAGALAVGTVYLSTITSQTVEVDRGPISERLIVRATVVAEDGVAKVKPRIAGAVTRVLVKEGDAVRKGDLLADIEAAEQLIEVERRAAEARAMAEEAARARQGERPEQRAV